MKSTTNTTSHTHQTKGEMFRTQYLSKWQEKHSLNRKNEMRKARPIPFLDDFEKK